MRTGAFLSLSHSQSLLLLLPADDDDARNGEQRRCSWWLWHPAQRHNKARDKQQNGRTRQLERTYDRLFSFLPVRPFFLSFSFFLSLCFFFFIAYE
jgi:hypothetical protein